MPQPTLPEIRAGLDRALAQMPAILDPQIPVAEAERALGRGLERVYAALARVGEHAAFREQTQLAVEEVRAALGLLMQAPTEDGAAASASAALAECLGGLQQVRWSLIDGLALPCEGDARPFLRASFDFPRVLDLEREVIRPGVPLDEPPLVIEQPPADVLPPPSTDAEMLVRARALEERLGQMIAPEPEPSPSDVSDSEPAAPTASLEEAHLVRFGPTLTEAELLRERAIDCLDELAMMGQMRRAGSLEAWASGDETERRLLTRVDAIAACGASAFSELVRALDDRPIPDPEMTFAVMFFLLCIAGDDTFDQAVRVFELADIEDAPMLEMCIDAFVFAPHTRINALLGYWLRSDDGPRRFFAVETLRRRRAMTDQQFTSMGNDPFIPVLASLAAALPNLAGTQPTGALGWFSRHDDERVVRAALESALRLRDPLGYSRSLELVAEGRGAFADAIVWVAIAGDESSFAPLEHDLATTCSSAALRAAGWYGDLRFVPFLLGRLEHGEPAEQAAALEGLERITGASIIDAGIVPEYEPGDEPFVRERRTYTLPGILDGTAEAWRAWWERWGGHAQVGTRYRWGQAYTLQDTFDELEDEERVYETRHHAAVELAVRGGLVVGLDRDEFVFHQRREMAMLGSKVGPTAVVTGWARSLVPEVR